MTTNRDDQGAKLPRWTILSVTTLSSFMSALDTNIVTIALPTISKGLGSGVTLLGWVITAYVLATAVLLLQSGVMGDRYGRRRVYLLGFATFGAASALCGLSPGVYELIAFRAVQGVGAAMLSAMALPIIFESFPPDERGSAVGINAVAFALGSIAGPVLGGALVTIDWRLIFFINVPVAAAAVLLGQKRIPKRLDARNESSRSINVASSILFALAVGFAMLSLTFFDARFAPLAAAAIVLFLVSELRARNPLLSRELVRNRGFVLTLVGLSVLQLAAQGILFVMSFYFQSVSGLTPLLAGLGLVPLPVALVFSNPIAGRLFDSLRRPALVSATGILMVACSLVLLAFEIGAPSASTYVFALLAVIGFGVGLVWAPTVSAALKFSSPELRGVANGTAFTVIWVMFAASITLAVTVSAFSLPPALASQIYLGSVAHLAPDQVLLFKAALSNALLAMAAAGFVGIPVFLLTAREQRKTY